MIASMYMLSANKSRSLLALIFTSLAGGLIACNYIIQTTCIPALVSGYSLASDPLIAAFSMSNPASMAWAIEMWGYGFLGIGTWLAAGFFTNHGVEKAAKIVCIANGIAGIIGALWTSFSLTWVLSIAGLIVFIMLNLLYLVLAILFLLVLRKRKNGTPGV